MTTMFIGDYAINTQLQVALLAESLHWLQISNVSVAELCDYAILVHEGFVAVEVQKTCLLVQIIIVFTKLLLLLVLLLVLVLKDHTRRVTVRRSALRRP